VLTYVYQLRAARERGAAPPPVPNLLTPPAESAPDEAGT
jgi:hypothetical protein